MGTLAEPVAHKYEVGKLFRACSSAGASPTFHHPWGRQRGGRREKEGRTTDPRFLRPSPLCRRPFQSGFQVARCALHRWAEAATSRKPAWFDVSDKSWVAGVELATASEPPARKPRIWGVALRASTPASPKNARRGRLTTPIYRRSSIRAEASAPDRFSTTILYAAIFPSSDPWP